MSLRGLQVIDFNSFSLSLLIDLKPRLVNSGFAGKSDAPFVIMLTALF